jgi:uncharacterized protein
MPSLHTLLTGPWPWYVAGPLIGLMVPLMLFIGNRSFGISQNLRHLCAITQPKGVEVSFFKYGWKESMWSLFFAVGTCLGGFLGAVVFANPEPVALSAGAQSIFGNWGVVQVRGLIPPELFDLSWRNVVVLAVGGVLVGFGTRYANGCTSGHAITGLAAMQPQSLLAVAGIFAGGLVSAHFVLPLVMRG